MFITRWLRGNNLFHVGAAVAAIGIGIAAKGLLSLPDAIPKQASPSGSPTASEKAPEGVNGKRAATVARTSRIDVQRAVMQAYLDIVLDFLPDAIRKDIAAPMGAALSGNRRIQLSKQTVTLKGATSLFSLLHARDAISDALRETSDDSSTANESDVGVLAGAILDAATADASAIQKAFETQLPTAPPSPMPARKPGSHTSGAAKNSRP